MADEQQIERRFTAADFEVRAEDGKPTRLEGYAAVFNDETQLADGYFESIAPGAFSRALSEKQDVRALFNHDPNQVLGRSTADPPTLTLREDKKGFVAGLRQQGFVMAVTVGI